MAEPLPPEGYARLKVAYDTFVFGVLSEIPQSAMQFGLEQTAFAHEVCEMTWAHTIGNKAEAAYRRGDLFEKRRKLMDAWAAFCEPQNHSKIVALKRK